MQINIVLFAFRALSKEEIQSIYRCETDPLGDLVQWSSSLWSTHDGAVTTNNNFQTLCNTKFEDDLILVPDAVTFLQAEFICSFLSGNKQNFK